MSQTTPTPASPLTVVLVHGAFADSSSWNGVIERAGATITKVELPRRHDLAAAGYRGSGLAGLCALV